MFVFGIIVQILFLFTFVDGDRERFCKYNPHYGTLVTAVINESCILPDGTDICCVAVGDRSQLREEETPISRGVGWEPTIDERYEKDFLISQPVDHCTITKQYEPSPLEKQHMEFAALYLYNVTAEEELRLVTDYVTKPSEIAGALKWMRRVHQRMQTDRHIHMSSVDKEYLSRFVVTKSCYPKTNSTPSNNLPINNDDGEASEEVPVSIVTVQWHEWIEPITLHTRNPLTDKLHGFGSDAISFMSTDYILLQSGRDEEKRRFNSPKNHLRYHYLYDLGSSIFSSSLYYFTCGYSQVRMSFDQVFAWELNYINPAVYWSSVPELWLPYVHFYNTDVSPDINDGQSPLAMISHLATKEDFVSLKIDIDYTESEISLFLDVLNNTNGVGDLIDEFFFELHYRAPELANQWKIWEIPEYNHGIHMQRYNVMKLFQDLRISGTRAHIWP